MLHIFSEEPVHIIKKPSKDQENPENNIIIKCDDIKLEMEEYDNGDGPDSCFLKSAKRGFPSFEKGGQQICFESDAVK